MGYIRHNAIVATAWQQEAVDALVELALREGAEALVGAEQANGYITVCITPDGSKEGWQESNNGNARRAAIRDWLHGAGMAGFYFEWCEVAYGSDDMTAEVVASEWAAAQPGETT